jgi:hypothetical protein
MKCGQGKPFTITSTNAKMGGPAIQSYEKGGMVTKPRTLGDEAREVYPERGAKEAEDRKASNESLNAAVRKAREGDYSGAAKDAAKGVGRGMRSVGAAASMVPGTYVTLAREALADDKPKSSKTK